MVKDLALGTNLLPYQNVDADGAALPGICRALATLLVDPKEPRDVRSLAKKCGMSREEMANVLSSPQWQEAIRSVVVERSGDMVLKGLHMVEQVIADQDQRTSDRLRAFQLASQVWQGARDVAKEKDPDEIIKKARAMIVTIRQSHESTARLSDPADATEDQEDQGGHRSS